MSTGYKIDEQDAIYFLTFQVVCWVDIFTRKEYKDIVINSLRFCQENKGLKIFAYVLMSNHVHVILQSSESQLSKTIKEFKSFTAKEILELVKTNMESRGQWMLKLFAETARKHKRNNHFQVWTHENHAEIIFSNAFFDQKVRYIHDNPVRADIVHYPEDYIYSSASAYAGKSNLLKIELLDIPMERKTLTRTLK